MYRVMWREQGEKYYRKSKVFEDLQDAKYRLRELKVEGYTDIRMEKAEWREYPSVKWVNRDS